MTLSVDIRHDFGAFTLAATFDAPAGVTALFGRSGAGKSTVIQAVAGLMRPDYARITVDRRTLCDTTRGTFLPPHRRHVGYVFQDARLFPHLTVKQNLLYGRFFARARLSPQAPALAHVADMLGISDLLSRMPSHLSGGEKQRVAIGRALLGGPEILLMDEPLAALDAARKNEILPYLERLRDETALPIVYVSHAPDEVARLATTVVLMEAGRVTACGPVAAVLSDPQTLPFGPQGAGGIINAIVAADPDDGLSRLDTCAGPIWVPAVHAAKGTVLRLRIPAQDVIIAREKPVGLSALNILPARILALHKGDGPGVMVQLGVGPHSDTDRLLARVTHKSAQMLELHVGQEVHAILKAVSVAQSALGPAPSSH